MPLSALTPPTTDPTPLFELFRGNYATELLTAAVTHFDILERVQFEGVLRTPSEIAEEMGITRRAGIVLTTALKAMGVLRADPIGNLKLTELAIEHLAPGGAFDIGGYLGLAAQSPGVLAMAASLKSSRPIRVDAGTVFTYRGGVASAMDEAESARHFTLALAGRAKNVAPHLAAVLDLSNATTLLDIGGGTGIYAIALLQKNPKLRAIVFDRAEVLKVAQEFAREYGVADRLELCPGDMFADPFPTADVALLSNVLHDWDVPECRNLVAKAAEASPHVAVHDVFLNDALDGPLPQALYSAALFTLTEGRLYSAAEVADWMRAAGLTPQPVKPTLVHCAILSGTR